MYKERFGERNQPHHTMFRRLFTNMEKNGKFICNRGRSRTVTNDDNVILTLASLYANPKISLRSVSGKK